MHNQSIELDAIPELPAMPAAFGTRSGGLQMAYPQRFDIVIAIIMAEPPPA